MMAGQIELSGSPSVHRIPRVWTFLTAWKPRLGHALRRVRVFKEAGKLSRRSRDEEAHPLRHPALKVPG